MYVYLFLATWQKFASSREREPQLRNYFQQTSLWARLWASFWLIIDVGGQVTLCGDHPWASDPEMYKNVDWASHGEETNKSHSFMALFQFLPPRFLLWVPALASHSDSWWCESLSQISPFLPKSVLVIVFTMTIEKPTGTLCDCGHGFLSCSYCFKIHFLSTEVRDFIECFKNGWM